MTQPIQEPSQQRTDQAANWGVRQLFRRPAQSFDPEALIGYLAWLDSDTIADGNWWEPPFWTDKFISTGATGLFDSVGGSFALDIDRTIGGSYLVEVRAQFSDTPPAGGYLGIGNLVQSGWNTGGIDSGSDIHHFEPADMLIANASNQAMSLSVIRSCMDGSAVPTRYVTMEVGNFSGGPINIIWCELTVVKIASPGDGEYSFT